MTRKETTKWLTDLLIYEKVSNNDYYAKEVTLDYGTNHPRRVDVMEFQPEGVMGISAIEKGIFVCYEIKSCIEDVYSGNGLNFFGEKNYIVTTMNVYKKLQDDIREGKLDKHIKEFLGTSDCPTYGFMIPVPAYIDLRKSSGLYDEFDNPTEINPKMSWKLWTLTHPRENLRQRSMNELLFCMLRARHNM